MTLYIIIVSWNGKEMLKRCLRSIFAHLPAEDFEMAVVDNGSEDGTPEMVKNDFPRVRLLANEKNFGFAKANNQALEQIIKLGAAPRGQTSAAGAPVLEQKLSTGQATRGLASSAAPLPDFVLFLNQDMEVLPGTFSGMVEFMRQHPQAGVAGCHLINNQGNTVPQARRFPTVWDQAAIILKLSHIFPCLLNKYLMTDFDYDKTEPQEVDSLRGSFLMTRREVWEKVGGFDERFFFWFEEVDFCKRVKQAGWQVMYNPAVKCVDLVGQSVKSLSRFKAQRMFTQSMLKYFAKWQPKWQYWLLWLLRPVGLGVALVTEIINSKFKMQKSK
ncbi:MAG: glycosyltransferase family 2 protein [bacterium]|nr:glycosyltransferase family 2 protein [bacterium]